MNNDGYRIAYCKVLNNVIEMICAEKCRCIDAITETDRQYHRAQVCELERIRLLLRKNRDSLLENDKVAVE